MNDNEISRKLLPKNIVLFCLAALLFFYLPTLCLAAENTATDGTGFANDNVITTGAGGRFEWLNSNTQAYYFFDKLSFHLAKDPYFKELYIDVWIRTQFLPEGALAEEYLRRQNDRPYANYNKLTYRMSHYWFHQTENKCYLLAVIDYDGEGNEISHSEYKYSPLNWQMIIPDTEYDTWRSGLFAYQQKLKDKTK